MIITPFPTYSVVPYLDTSIYLPQRVRVLTHHLHGIFKPFGQKEINSVSQVYSELEGIIDKLAKEVQKGTLPRKVLPKPQPLQSPTANLSSSPPKSEIMFYCYK